MKYSVSLAAFQKQEEGEVRFVHSQRTSGAPDLSLSLGLDVGDTGDEVRQDSRGRPEPRGGEARGCGEAWGGAPGPF